MVGSWWSELAHSLWYDPCVCPHGQPAGEGRLRLPHTRSLCPALAHADAARTGRSLCRGVAA